MFGLNRLEVSDLKKENKDLKYANDAYRKRLESEMATASYAIDWDAMKVFSVERMWENGLPKTVLGYMLSEPVITSSGEGVERITEKDIVREWTLYCSAETHERLVTEFREWLKTKK